MAFNVPKMPFSVDNKEPRIKLVPWVIFIPCSLLIVLKWSSTLFVYVKGSDEVQCAVPTHSGLTENQFSGYCKVNIIMLRLQFWLFFSSIFIFKNHFSVGPPFSRSSTNYWWRKSKKYEANWWLVSLVFLRQNF